MILKLKESWLKLLAMPDVMRLMILMISMRQGAALLDGFLDEFSYDSVSLTPRAGFVCGPSLPGDALNPLYP